MSIRPVLEPWGGVLQSLAYWSLAETSTHATILDSICRNITRLVAHIEAVSCSVCAKARPQQID